MRKEKGFTGVDIIISIFVITIFVAIIGNLIINVNLNNKSIERRTIATSYAIQEIEKIKSLKYQEQYNNKGLKGKEILEQKEIYQHEKFTGYNKTIYIEDYISIIQNGEKEPNIVKQITIEISYLLGNKNQTVELSTYIVKE